MEKFRVGLLAWMLASVTWAAAAGQAAVTLPDVSVQVQADSMQFRFVSDGPTGSGWGQTSKIARFYVRGFLPALFSRTLVLDDNIPRGTTLSWIFTGHHAGFTIELNSRELRVFQRYYDSYALYGVGKPEGNYPQKIMVDTTIPYTGHPRELKIVLNAHMALQVWLNGSKVVEQSCLFDVQREQLAYTAPRNEHDVVAGVLLPEQTEDAAITVHPSQTFQTILGFGGSPSIPTYAELSPAGKEKFWQIIRSYNLLIDREYPMGTRLQPDMSNLDDLNDASPHYYGDNFPNGEVSDFSYNRHIQQLGGSVIYEMWDLPNWATVPGEQPHGHAVANPEAYARAMVTYCRIEKQRTGRPPAIVGVQNEVQEPQAVALQMVRVLRQRLDEAGFSSVKIHMADAPFTWQGVQRAEQLKQHPEIWKSIDYAAVHEYDYQDFFSNPDLFDPYLRAMHQATAGKPFIATEICLNKRELQTGSYRVAFNVGQLYHKNLTIMDAVGLLYCWVILDTEQPNFEASRSLLMPDKNNGEVPIPSSFQLRVLGSFSRHLRSGMQRVDAQVTNPNLLATAWRGPEGEATVVILNRGTHPEKLAVNWSGVRWQEMETTTPYLANVVSTIPSQLVIAPGEILTLSTIVDGPAVN